MDNPGSLGLVSFPLGEFFLLSRSISDKAGNPGRFPGMESLRFLWEKVLERLCGTVNPQSFHTWFKPTRLVGYSEGKLTVEGPNPFFIDWLSEHHHSKIARAASEVIGKRVVVEFTSAPVPPRAPSPIYNEPAPAVSESPRSLQSGVRLNARYTFDEFVVGSGNRLTHAAALAVSENPARAYNPLFIYGGVGLGKTHLLQAIGHHIIRDDPGARIAYVSTESFMNELIHAIKTGITLEFKERYRKVDVLLVDDIQFLAGKESTQEEFFFTFNALHNANKQIVVTSDSPPKEIPRLQQRLTSRFEWGLITDIQPPDLETRIAILQKKVEKEKIQISHDVIQIIAESVKNNIRELEGSLIKLLACASLTRREINEEMALGVLRDIVKSTTRKKPSVQAIIKTVAQDFDVPQDSLRARTRISRVVLARQVSIYLCRQLTDLSLVNIGKFFGGRDHSTILHSLKKIERLILEDPAMREKVERVKKGLYS